VKPHKIVIDTNVLLSAIRSNKGASFKLLSIIDSKKYKIQVSVPLVLEYEEVLKRNISRTKLSEADIEDLIDYICFVSDKRRIYYLWRPVLKDPKDDCILELAVESQCEFIITYNKKDFYNIEKFNVKAITPKEFLLVIGEIK
jgi:putative PIN family toxin of toxin-antitoxin system